MATEYCLIYKFTGQDNTSGNRSVDLSRFSISGDTDKNIGRITRIEYVHWHTSAGSMSWGLRGRLLFSDDTNIVSDQVYNRISGNVVEYTNTFTFDKPMTKTRFEQATTIQTIDTQDKATSGGYSSTLYWRATSTYPMYLYVYFIEADYMMYGVDEAWKECEVFYGVDGEWKRVTPYYGIDGVWKSPTGDVIAGGEGSEISETAVLSRAILGKMILGRN